MANISADVMAAKKVHALDMLRKNPALKHADVARELKKKFGSGIDYYTFQDYRAEAKKTPHVHVAHQAPHIGNNEEKLKKLLNEVADVFKEMLVDEAHFTIDGSGQAHWSVHLMRRQEMSFGVRK